MPNYRVQVMVGVDIEAESPEEAFSRAINKVRAELGEDPLASHPKPAWVNGIVQCDPTVSGHTAVEGYMIFETTSS